MRARGYSLGQTYRAARDEARRRGDRRISTEHLVLALLADPSSTPATVLGCELTSARAALEELDREALLTIGIDVTSQAAPQKGPQSGRLPLTPAAKAVLQASTKVAGHRRRLAPEHVLLALTERQQSDPAMALLVSLGLDPAVIRDRLGAA